MTDADPGSRSAGGVTHPLGRALQARDVEAALALCADDVVFRSPVVFAPYEGKAAFARILHAVAAVLEDFAYVQELSSEDATDHALRFTATVAGRAVDGCDFVRRDDSGLVTEVTVMVRPLSAILALAEAMKRRLEGGAAEAGADRP